MKINLVIPCYNEEDSVRNLYNNLAEFGDNDIYFYILDNGSIDATQDVLKDLSQTENIKFLNLQENRGYGYGVHYGLKEISKADQFVSDARVRAIAVLAYIAHKEGGKKEAQELINELNNLPIVTQNSMSKIQSIMWGFWNVQSNKEFIKDFENTLLKIGISST